ncbi:MAG: WG repeat-containing protein [bacterium]
MDKNKKTLICIATTSILLTQAYTINTNTNTNTNTNLITKVYANDYYTHNDLVVLEIDDNYSAYALSTYNDGLFVISNKDYKYGLMDISGNIILEPEYNDVKDFVDGIAVVIKKDDNDTKSFSLVNTSGEFLTPFTEIESINNFSEGLLAVQKNNKYGFIDNTGTEVIPFDYRLVTDFSSGLAKVWTDDKSYFIDKDNNIVLDVESKYASVGNAFYEGLLIVKNENNKWGFINTSGVEVTSFIYDEFINSSQYGLHAVKRDGKWGFIDETGTEIIPLIYDSVNDFSEGFCYVTKDSNSYFIDTNGNIILSSNDVPYAFASHGVYDGLISFIDKSIYKEGYYDINGNIIIPAIYDLGYSFNNGFTVVKKDDKEYIIKNPLYGNIDDSNDVESESEQEQEESINPNLTAINGLSGVYVMPSGYGNSYYIVDKDSNKLVDIEFREVATELGIGDTLEVRYIAGMADSRAGLLDKELNIIVPNSMLYYSTEFIKSGGVYYVKATGATTDYYDLKGNKLDYEPVEDILNPNLTAINGLNGVYILPSGYGNSYYIVDENSNKLIDIEFREVATQLGVKDTLEVRYISGMTDSRAGLLDKDLNIIVPNNSVYYSIQFVKSNEVDYVKAIGGYTDYYDLSGAKLEYELVEDIALLDTSYSWWAKDDVLEAYDLNLVPADLLANFTDKITRQEFCHLALQTYFAKTGDTIKANIQTPFTDVDDPYVTTAYNLGIISGHGNGLFTPNDLITRQESAVMVNNLANVLNLTSNSENRSFVDTSYFADWAKDAIYSVSSMHLSDGIFVMTGTGEGKFSPWFNYDREQAIITMLRIFNYQ